MITARSALTSLQSGVEDVAEIWHESGGSHRIIEEVFREFAITRWATSRLGLGVEDMAGSQDGQTRVAVLEERPIRKSGLNDSSTFQTRPASVDKIPTVFVRLCAFSPLWAGVLLVHEMEHAIDYRNGNSSIDESEHQWESLEGRVHGHEAHLIDVMSGGGLRHAVKDLALEQVLAGSIRDFSKRVRPYLHLRLRGKALSSREENARDAAVGMSGVVAIAAQGAGTSIPEYADETDLGPLYRAVLRWAA